MVGRGHIDDRKLHAVLHGGNGVIDVAQNQKRSYRKDDDLADQEPSDLTSLN